MSLSSLLAGSFISLLGAEHTSGEQANSNGFLSANIFLSGSRSPQITILDLMRESSTEKLRDLGLSSLEKVLGTPFCGLSVLKGGF